MIAYACRTCLAREGDLHMKGCPWSRDHNGSPMALFGVGPTRCRRCDGIMNNFFSAEEEIWEKVVEDIYPTECDLCKECFLLVAKLRGIKVGPIKRLKKFECHSKSFQNRCKAFQKKHNIVPGKEYRLPEYVLDKY